MPMHLLVWANLAVIKSLMVSWFYDRKIEEKRGVTVTDSGIPEVKPSPSVNGLLSQASSKVSGTVNSTVKSSPTWDEDWGLTPTTKGPATSLQNSTNNPSTNPVLGFQPIPVTSLQSQSSMIPTMSSQQTAVSCPPVDIEWPPRASSRVTPQIEDAEKQLNAGASSTSSFDDIDPFADWPPRPTGSVSGAGTYNNGTMGKPTNKYGSSSLSSTSNKSMNFQTNTNSTWAFNTHSSLEPIRENQGNPTLTSGSLGGGGVNPLSSIAFLKQTQGIPASDNYTDKRLTDIGSIFASSKNEQSAPRLAPPPSTAVGRGRGRGRGASSASRTSHAKSQSEQPPLLDLL
jgi:SCY1-like protein 2